MQAATAKSHAKFQNILFATDFSLAASHAIPYVKTIAEHYGSNVFAFHVRPPVVNPMTPPGTWNSAMEAANVADDQVRKELCDTFAGIKTQVLIEEGDLQSLLDAAIQKNNIDLVVIGTRGRTGMDIVFLGSVAEGIFRTVSCPVFTVGPQSAWSTAEVQEVLFATGFAPDYQIAAEYAVSLAQEFGARLSLLHVFAEPQAGDLVTWSDTISATKDLLRQLVPQEAESRCKPEYFVEQGDPAERILDLASIREASLIVLGAQPDKDRPWTDTHSPIAIAYKVVCHAKCPVLTVRNK